MIKHGIKAANGAPRQHRLAAGAVAAGLMLGAAAATAAPPPALPAITLALGGDLIGPYRQTSSLPPEFAPVAALFAAADVGIANFEGACFDLASHRGPAAAETGGGYPVIPPDNAAMLARTGIRLVAKANNHATDWGYDGLAATLSWLTSAGMAQAGAGRNQHEAAAPAYVASPAGTVALISVATTFTPMSVAGPTVVRNGLSFDRFGINALHVHEVRLVRAATLRALRRAVGDLAIAVPGQPGDLRIGDQIFRAAPRQGTAWEANPADVTRILDAVSAARARARIVVLAIHAHETAGHDDDLPPGPFEPLVLHRANEAPSPDDPRPAGFLQPLFHQAIGAGADVVMRTGPHQLNGVEVWRGKPIFYGLGSLVFSFGGRRSYTAPGGQTKALPPGWFETMVPVLRFEADGATTVTLHPAALRSSQDPLDGLPEPPAPVQAAAILDRVSRMSAGYGTKVTVTGGTAVLRIPPLVKP